MSIADIQKKYGLTSEGKRANPVTTADIQNKYGLNADGKRKDFGIGALSGAVAGAAVKQQPANTAPGAIAGATAGVKKPSNGISINDIFKPKAQNTGALATIKKPDYGFGNIDLNNRPTIDNGDGSYSTVDSVSFWDEKQKKEVLVPTVIKVGGEWKHVGEDEAWEHYLKTGEHFGMFDTPEAATDYALKLHDDQAKQYNDPEMDDYLTQITAKVDKANAKNENAELARANVAYTGEKGIAGIGKSVQDFINEVANMGTILMRNQQAQDANSIAAFGALTGNDELIDTAVRQQQDAQQPLDLKPAVDFGTRFTQQVEEKYSGKISGAGKVGGEISSAIGYMVPSIVTNLVTRGLGAAANPGLYTMATSAAGGATEEALAAGADDERAIMYGTAVGLTTALTEKLTGGLQIFGKGTLDDAIEGTAKKLLKNESAQYAAMKLWGLLGEGVEEFAEELAGRLHSELFVDLGSDTHMDDRGVAETFGDAGRSFVMGVIVSGVLQTGLNIMSPTEATDRKALAQKAADTISEDVDKQVALHKFAQENSGELQVMVESIILARDYAEGSESRKLGGELETALYNLIRSGDSAGVRQFFKANRQLFAQLSRSLEQEAESARPADAAQRVNENLLQHSRDNAHVMEEGESRAFDALVAQGMTNAEAIEVAEIVERIVSGDDTLSNNEIIKAGVTKDKRVRAAINALTGSELDTSKQNMKPSEAKPLMRDIIDRIKAQKQAEAAAVENAAIEGSAQIDVAEMVAETAVASATAENADAAAKFISLAKPAAEAEIKPQSGSVKSEGYVIDEEEIRAVGREEGFADKEIDAIVDEFEAMAREAGIDAEENPDAFINYSIAQENENGIKVDGYRPGVITAEQQLTTDILKAALADLGVKDVVLVTGSPSMLGTNGRYENGTVYVNADRINTQTYNGIAWVVGHEITHAAERAGVALKRNGETVANAPIVNNILEVMADMAKDGAITGTYARAALDSDAMQSLIERKKTAQHRFYMKNKVRADGSIIKGMSKEQAEKAFNDFDAKAEIAADFLGTLMGSNMLHESDGRLGSKYGPADLLSMMDEKKPGLLQQIRDFVIELRDKVMGQTPKTAAERKAKTNTQRHLTKLSRSLAENMRAGSERESDGVKDSVFDDSWEQQCDDVLSGKMNRHSAMFIAETPNLLAEVGLYDLPMTFTQKHFRAAVDGSNPSHPGKISLADMKELPRLLSQPVAILGSNTNPMGAVLVVTTARDSLNNPVVAAILPEGSAEVDAHKGTTNHILTVYGANHLHTPTTNGGMSTLERAASKGEVLYINKKRSQDLYQADGLQLPRALGSLNFDTIIREWNGYVKKNPPAREAKNVFTGDTIQWSVDDGVYAAPMYSKLQREIEAFRGDKIGASSAVSYLRGKGVKAEEIKWSGIETFLEGKKSVGKQELLDWLRENELTLTATVLGETEPNDYYHLRTPAMNPDTGEVIADWGEFEGQAYEMAERMGYDWEEVRFDENDGWWQAYINDPETGLVIDLMEINALGEDGKVEAETRWEDYKTPGGSNYREYLFKMPGSDYINDAMSVHWNDSGILAHARVQDFDHDGKPVLFIEEIQSDWHNAGAKQGYASKERAAKVEELDALERKYTWGDALLKEGRDRIVELRSELYPEQERINKEFDENEAKWRNDPTLYGLVEYVATELFDGNTTKARDYLLQDSFNDMGLVDANVEWLTRRYEMDIKPEEHEAVRDYYRTLWRLRMERHELDTKKRNDKYAAPEAPYAKNYHEYVLKNLLRKAAEGDYGYLAWTPGAMQEERWSSEYAEGYRIEYDQDIPKFLNKYGKQWGAKVGRIGLDGVDTGIVDEAYIDSLAERNSEIRSKLRTAQTLEEATQLRDEARKIQAEVRKARLGTVWAIPITKQMRDSVLYEGQPMYSVDDSIDKSTENEYSTVSNSEEAEYGREESTDNRGRQNSGRADSRLPDSNALGSGNESRGGDGRGNLAGYAGKLIPEKTRKILDDKGTPNAELDESELGAFSAALDVAKAANPNGGMVDSQPVEKLRENKARTFMRRDGGAGVAVEGDGNIVGVFKNPEYKQPRVVSDLLYTAIEQGGNKLDCYVTYERNDLRAKYSAHGFTPVCWLEFSREYAPDGWNYEAWGEPDVVMWVHNGDSLEQMANRKAPYRTWSKEEIRALPKYEDYDEAKVYQAKKVQEVQRQKAREEAIRRVFRNARDMYGEGDAFVERISGESQTKAGRDRLMQIFRPQTEQARAEQRTQDDLRLQRERQRAQERTARMREAFGIEKRNIREQARIDKMAALAVQEQKLDAKWQARMDSKIERLREQAAERLRIQKYKSDFIRAYENLAAQIREKKAKAEGKRKLQEERRRNAERAGEQRVLSRRSAKEARSILAQSRTTARPDYTNDEVDTLRELPEEVNTSKISEWAQKLRTAGKRLYASFVNQAQAIDNFSKLQLEGVKAGSLVNMVFGSASTIETIYQNELVGRDGRHLGGAMKEVFLTVNDDGSIDQDRQATLQDYMLHQHNIDRMSFTARALARVEAIEAQHPWLTEMDTRDFAYAAALNDSETEATGTEERRTIVREYAAALKALKEAEDKPIFADKNGKPVSADTSREIVARYEAEQPWLKDKAEGIYEWWDNFMREWAVGSTLSAEEYDAWKQLYPHYVPTYREMGGAQSAVQVGGAAAQVMDIYKGAKGSTKPVKNIEESFSMLVRNIVDTSRKNELLRNVIDTAMLDTEEVFSDFAIFDWEGFYEAYAENFMDSSDWLGGDSYTQAEEHFKSAIEELDGGYRITAYNENGERFSAWLSKEMYRSLAAVTATSKLLGEGTNVLTRIGGKLTNPMKAMITGYNPNFALRNMMRDIPTAIVNSISGLAFPKYYARAIKNIAQGSEAWRQFKALGGTHFGYYGMSTDWAKRMEKKPGVFKKGKDALGAFSELTESATRFAEYIATIDKLGDTYEGRVQGIKNAAEVTVDFSRKGEYGKLANAWIPYWNPAVQGINKTFRQIFSNGTTVKQKFAGAGITLTRAALIAVLPEVLQYLLLKSLDRYDDWEKLSDRMRDSYYCIPIAGENKFLKIPKTREWGTILGTPLMRILEGVNGRSDPFDNFVEDALLANFSVAGVEDAIGIGTLIDLRTNKDFAGRDIVPYAYQEASASMQYDSDTTAIAYGAATAWNKTLAKLAEELGMDVELSPMQLDYIISDYCGDFVYMFMEMASLGLFNGSTSLMDIGKEMLGSMEGTWVGDNRYSNFYTGEYYDILDYLDKGIADEKLLNPEDYTSSYIYKLDKAFNEAYGKRMTELNKAAAQLPDGEEKDAIKDQISELAIEATDWFRNELINNSDDPFLRVSYGDFTPELQDALIELDGLSSDYHFKPSPATAKSYTDPANSKKEFVLTEEQYKQYKAFYMEAYDEIMSKAVNSRTYKSGDAEERAAYLDEARDDVHTQAKEELFKWLRKQGVKSTAKEK